MKTAEALRGKEDLVLSKYGIQVTGNRHIDCQLCGGKKKLRINYHQSALCYICVCGSGSIIKYIMELTNQSFKDVARDIDGLLGNTFETKPNRETEKVYSLRDRALSRFQRLPLLHDTPAQDYLRSRQIYSIPTDGVKYNAREGAFSSLYAVATDNQCNPVYLHRTLLDGGRKANVTPNKKMLILGDSGAPASIKLYPVQSTLGVAEGIETALSCRQIYKCSVWSTLNTSILKRFKAPPGVEHLILFADNDRHGAGLAAAFDCAHKNLMANNDVLRVSVRWPESVCDFNDMLIHGSEVLEWTLTR